jgi:hypothetical protein
MIIDRKKVGNKQIRTYKMKLVKKELDAVAEDILGAYKINKNVVIEVKEE